MSENQPQKSKPGKIVHAQAVSYSGPIPPPAMLEEYNRIVPGSADRILRMAEEQSVHRHSLEKKVIGTSFASLVAAFIYGTQSRKTERQNRGK